MGTRESSPDTHLPSSFLVPEGGLNVGAEERVKDLNLRQKWAREAIFNAQQSQIKAYNSEHKEVIYSIGDLVLIDPHKLNLLEAPSR
ncbi:uncharacterized protein EI90DRAFT_3121712 [Cantharellus anzutake]|uniref:uncharacterized protein n=1 Tax=Cantharellus anzutake TaxID=1750568 RepID=UPI00190374FE|nr:uncharacterized protein EI90DRAFT_3121712 [Cantharellus anzutake]KAF8333448.1 hypothetical protein EI90DRAFT_3121712 [Cantharellus anzutake]